MPKLKNEVESPLEAESGLKVTLRDLLKLKWPKNDVKRPNKAESQLKVTWIG